MTNCYYYEEYTLGNDGSLDPVVDCTYVLTMTNSTRKEQIKQHLTHAGLTSRLVFQYNHGYKGCAKPLKHNGPNYDLCHANQTAFQHALDRGYKRILLLEDDCEFDHRIKDPEILSAIRRFLYDHDPDIYNLGTTICATSPIDIILGMKHRRLLMSFSTHAVIYNRKYMEWLIHNSCLLGHTDTTHNIHWSKFTYRVPLAYQKQTLTENAKYGWGYGYHILNTLFYKPFRLDTHVQPGHDYVRIIFDISTIIVFLFFLKSGYILYKRLIK